MKITLITNNSEEFSQSEIHLWMHKKIGSVDYRRLSNFQQKHLADYINQSVDLEKDRTVIDLSFKYLIPQVRILESTKNLVLIDSKSTLFNGSFTRTEAVAFLEKLPWARIILRSKNNALVLRKLGFDAIALPHASESIQNSPSKMKDIDLGFVTQKRMCSINENLLKKLRNRYPTLYESTGLSSISYYNTMSRIKVFICLDKDDYEYNKACYDAMAAGALVLSPKKPMAESEWLGLEDKKNILFFDSDKQLFSRLDNILSGEHEEAIKKITATSKENMEENFSYKKIGESLADAIMRPVRDIREFPKPRFIFGIRLKNKNVLKAPKYIRSDDKAGF